MRAWWMVAAGLVGLGLAVTPGLGGHAGTGIQTGLAIPADMVHVAAMACWLGGLVVLCIAVLPKGDADELRAVLPRYSALALGAIVALIVSGGYQAWRQVGSIDALKSTDYGRLLIAKLVVFAALIVAAAFSREVVNRRFRDYAPDDEDVTFDEYVMEPLPVAVGVSSGGRAAGSAPERQGRFDDDGYDDDWDDDTTDEEEVRRLRRSVAVEVVIAAVILSITALLVNAAPARAIETQPVSLTLKSRQVWVYVDVAPGIAGPNDIHFTALPTGGGPATIDDMSVQLTRPGEDLPPFAVPLQKLGNGPLLRAAVRHPVPGQVADDHPCATRPDRRSGAGESLQRALTCPASRSPPTSSSSSRSWPTRWSSSRWCSRSPRWCRPGHGPRWCRSRPRSAPQAVLLAWIVATVTTLGSLYYSEHAGFVPCELCWYQRIVMYPLVIVLGVAWLRRDAQVWMTVLVFVVIGAPLSLYHWLVERVPAFAESSSCSVTAPCTAPYFEKLGFVTLAWMA